MSRSAHRYALITGASSGIGAAMAHVAADAGCSIGLAARRGDRMAAHAETLRARKIDVDVFVVDLSVPGSAAELTRRVHDQGRRVDVLVNNAGATLVRSFANAPLSQQQAFLELTINTPVALAHTFLPKMLEQRFGRIINISSIAALSSGAKGNTLYPAGKSFLLKFSQSLNAEVKDRGVHVTAVLPGFVATEFQQANNIPMDGGAPRRFSQTPEEVAREAWTRNDKGDEIVVPGSAPKLAAALMRALPEPWMRALTRRAAEKYYVDE